MLPAGGLTGHGGRLCVARALYPNAPEPWVDLSTGINPEPYPDVRASAAARARLPTPEEIRDLEMTAGRAFGVEDGARIAATAGSEAVLRLVPYALRCEAAAVLGPTYSSHSAAWRKAGVRVDEVSLGAVVQRRDAAVPEMRGAAAAPSAVVAVPACDTVAASTHGAAVGPAHSTAAASPATSAQCAGAAPSVASALTRGATVALMRGAALTLVNPNNPDGAVVDRAGIARLHDDVASCEGYLIVDEAFADVQPGCSVASLAGTARYPRLVVLRSFGKFHGLAGVRLGFVIAAPVVIARFRELLGDWPVSADAIAVGLAAYADDAWAARTRERLLHSAHRLDDALTSNGFEIVGGTSLFRLARCDDARDRFEHLLRAGILTRPFDHDSTLLRFGLPGEPSAWRRLADALRKP